ncbi:MAG: NUDIX domain-containing protein [bacterium]|nr:NUDIX domain-containing protein [bacterium]
MYRPNVAAVVRRDSDGKYLVVHKPRKHHAWQFPQGGIDPGESPKQAVLRELEEELGTRAFKNFRKSHHVYFYRFADGKLIDDKYTGQKQSYFLVEFIGTDEDIKLCKDELDEFRWVYQTELGDYLESKEYLQKIQQVINEFQ